MFEARGQMGERGACAASRPRGGRGGSLCWLARGHVGEGGTCDGCRPRGGRRGSLWLESGQPVEAGGREVGNGADNGGRQLRGGRGGSLRRLPPASSKSVAPIVVTINNAFLTCNLGVFTEMLNKNARNITRVKHTRPLFVMPHNNLNGRKPISPKQLNAPNTNRRPPKKNWCPPQGGTYFFRRDE